MHDRFFALSGQCLPCSAQTAKAVYGANLIFTISMTIAMVLLPEILVSFWCGCNIRLAGLGHALLLGLGLRVGRYKVFIGVGGITCILGGNLQSSNETVRSILIIFRLFNVCITLPHTRCH